MKEWTWIGHIYRNVKKTTKKTMPLYCRPSANIQSLNNVLSFQMGWNLPSVTVGCMLKVFPGNKDVVGSRSQCYTLFTNDTQ